MNPPAITIPPVPSQTYLYHTTLQPRPKLILIGDSITEQGSAHEHGWGTSLSIRYSRRLDVMNRGMNGYNSRWGREALPFILEEILGPREWNAGNGLADAQVVIGAVSQRNEEATRCVNGQSSNQNEQYQQSSTNPSLYSQYTFIIGYGANDSCLPNGTHSRHHVPLNEYSSNIKYMVQLIQSWSSSRVSVALMTPPPCDTQIMSASRHNEDVTSRYAQACLKVGEEMNVPVVDLWNGMQHPAAESEEFTVDAKEYGDTWKKEYLSDGLHLTPLGNYRLYQLVVQVLEKPLHTSNVNDNTDFGLGLSVKQIPRHYPDHSLVDAENPEVTFHMGS